MNLQTWIITPRDSLIVRDGKPFGANITHATSLDFPFPSTTTGGARTRIGLNQDGIFNYSKESLKELKEIEIRGSLLTEVDENDEISEFYLSAPADALLLQADTQIKEKKAQLYRLFPLEFRDALTDLDEIYPIGLNRTDKKAKPCSDLAFWSWSSLSKWLENGKDSGSINLKNYGLGKLLKDSRTHVAINLDFGSDEGDLFSTRGLEFNYAADELSKTKKLALTVFIDKAHNPKLENKGNLAPLGGERRLVNWKKSENTTLFDCPDKIKNQIINEKHCRLMLLTPAYFQTGMPQNTAEYQIKAIACNRYQTVSGWDFEYNRPKPTRRLLPDGSVLFLDLQNNKDIENWIEKTWFGCLGDDRQFVADGFGLCVLGTWNGETLKTWE